MHRVVLVLAVGLSGCGPGGGVTWPDLHPAAGVVTRGGRPVSGGALRLTADGGPGDLIVTAEVGPDGTFTLFTAHAHDKSGGRRAGAPAGKYTATYAPPLADQARAPGSAEPVTLPQPVTVEAKDNTLKLELPKAR